MRLLDDPAERAERIAALSAPHIAPLDRWARSLEDGRPVPHPDPLDGGVEARVLLLLETPAAGPSPLRFVSRDNASPTARNLRAFLARIERRDTLIWNVVPWVLHPPGAPNRPVRAAELRAGLATLPSLLTLLPRLVVVVLAGRPARAALPLLSAERPDLPVELMPHPSPTFVCTSPRVAIDIQAALDRAAQHLRKENGGRSKD